MICSDCEVIFIEDNRKTYVINEYKITFIKVHFKDGYVRGYNSKRKKWASLFDNCIHFDDSLMVSAELVND